MKDIKNYEGLYAITSCGKVWSYISKKFLKTVKMKNGYSTVMLYKNKVGKRFLVHRLVAEAYVENPQNLKSVDHINGNKDHNYVKNLQWMTLEDNTRKEHNTKVRCVETGEVFDSYKIAAKAINRHPSAISACLRGKQKTAGGYHWEVV